MIIQHCMASDDSNLQHYGNLKSCTEWSWITAEIFVCLFLMVNNLMRQYILHTYVCVCVFIKHAYTVSFFPFPHILQMYGLKEMVRLLLIPAMECCLIGHDIHVNHFYIWLSLGYCFLFTFEMYYYVEFWVLERFTCII